jgi:MFS family permease
MPISLLVAVCFLSFTSFSGSRVLMSLFALELGASGAAVGVLISLYALFPLLLSIIAGRVVDRVGSFRPVLYGSAGFAGALLIPFFVPTLTALYVAATLMGLSLVFFGVATQHLVSSLGGPEERNRNVSLYSLGLALTGLSGPLLAGYMIDHHGHVPAFLALSLVVVLASVLWVVMRGHVPRVAGPVTAPPARRVAELLRLPGLRRMMIVSGIIVAGIDLFAFYMPIYGHSIGLSATMIGVVLGAYAVATFLVRGVMPFIARRYGEARVITWSLLVAGVAYFVLPFSQHLLVLILLSFALGVGLGCGQPLSIIMVYNSAPEGRSGEALGVRFTVVNFMHLAIPLTFGTMSAALGLAPVFLSNSALMFGGWWLSRRVKTAGAH